MSAGLPVLDLPSSGGERHNASVHKMPSNYTLGTDEDEDVNFDSPEDEVAYYRERYRRIVDMLNETRAELDEFQASSKELEDELERELGATEKQQAELRDRIKRLEHEKEEWKAKHVALQKMHSSTTSTMQREMDNLRSERDKALVVLRDLEMGNDELERNERVAASSLLDAEMKYNRAIEEKTLLEQDVVQKQELEEECQRLKDEIRDANEEVAILRDQISRAVPTPPSSVSAPVSPLPKLPRDLSYFDDNLAPVAFGTPIAKSAAGGFARDRSLVRSSTASSIPALSPSMKRFSSQLPASPSAATHLNRSTTSRNLSNMAGPASPAIIRSRSGMLAPSPGRAAIVNANTTVKNKGFRLLHDLQAKLKATDDKLGSRMSRRNVSAPMPVGATNRTISAASSRTAPEKAPHARIAALTQESTPLPSSDRSNGLILSPNSWVLVNDDDETPPVLSSGFSRQMPVSPLDPNFRSTSTTSSKALPVRPGIPSPLALALSKSTVARGANRPQSRKSALAHSTMPPSRHTEGEHRPLSPSKLPQPTRSLMSPTFGQSGIPASSPRPPSRQSQATRLDKSGIRNQHHVLGRGHPPPSMAFPDARPLGMSVSTSTPTALRRSARRSSFGVSDATLPPTGIPLPKSSTPTRPMSVSVFGSTPPPVPRIPSAHLRESSKRQAMVGRSTVERPRSGVA